MEVLGEALLSHALDFLFGQLASADLLKLASEEGVDTELKNWRTELVGIKLTLSDAEEKQITDCQVKSWLIDLRALVYDMEDVIDEFAYHVMRRKLAVAEADDEPGTSKNRKLSKFIPTCFSNFRPTHAVRLLNMRPKIRNISARLQSISDTKGNLVLKEAIKKAAPARRTLTPTTDMAYQQVYGRDEDKRLILNMLHKVVDQTCENNFGVISIVGPGGVGKTTLARLVYNDNEVAKNFELRAWACVSDVFDLGNITKSILCSVKGYDASSSSDFQTVQRQLRDALANKKLLLVLDDVWTISDHDWDNLQIPLSATAKGSRVIVTTRDKTAALNMGSGENLHPLMPLSDDACWSVFEKQALTFRNEVDRRELEPVGREIVAKYCRGSPLATKALGGLLRIKCTTEEWKGVLNSKFWELSRVKSEIFPVLFLSYHHLPSHLKRCFAYCAIFPQDYVFKPKTLMLLWMAEGLIAQPNSTGQTMEDLGDQYFQELYSRSFFQPSGSNPSRFVMHDLMHNLAHDVSDGMCFCLEDKLESDQRFQTQINNTRHLSIISRKFHLFKKFENFQVLHHLRTFVALPIRQRFGGYILVLDDLILKFQQLRVLSLSGCMISLVPDFVGGLKHLRYLNLSDTLIESVPHTITNLHNLQTLLLSHCRRLKRLPDCIGNLISLRHMDVYGCPLEDMPQKIVKLKQLQTLSNLIVGKKGFLGMKELKDLPNLKKEIHIEILQNGVDPQDARDVNIKDKLKNIEKLSIIWRRGNDSYDEDVLSLQPRANLKEKDILLSLQPHINLKDLSIEGYYGEEFLDWISSPSYSNLVALSLRSCVKCKSLPPVGQLPFLKNLDISGMNGVESIGVEFEGQVSVRTKPFRCLERLSFHRMKEWKKWSWSPESFSSLAQLRISGCEKLVGELPIHLTSLVVLAIDDCPRMKVPLPEDLHSLRKFNIYYCKPRFDYRGRGAGEGSETKNVNSERIYFQVSGMEGGLYQELKQSLPSAVELLEVDNSGELRWEWVNGFGVGKPQSLEIRGYKQLESLGEEEGRAHGLPLMLTDLSIEGCESLRSLPGWINNCYLERLKIVRCPSLICLPRGPLTPTLKRLDIWNCENLESLPEEMCMSSSLEELCILTCPGLIGFPEGGLPPTLKKLSISRCEKLGCLPEGIMQMHHDPRSSALEYLCIEDCPSLTGFPSGKFPATLNSLSIHGCVQLPPISNDMFDPSHNSLEGLTLVKYPNLKTLPDFLHSLKRLCIEECENLELESHPFRNLTSLACLEISGCKKIKTPVSEWGLAGLTSLTSLTIGSLSPDATLFSLDHHRHLPPLPASLHDLTISGLQNLESLASLSLQTLTSLRFLSISDCLSLYSLMPKEGFPDTLSTLWIERCPKLHSFVPKDGLPDMLSDLIINGCPLLFSKVPKNDRGRLAQDCPHF